jgi:hypothetical protein
VIHSDIARQRILVGCKDGGQPDSHALLWSPKATQKLPLRTLHPSNQLGERWVRVNGYAGDAFVDLDRDRVFPLAQHEWVRAFDGPRAIVDFWDGQDSHGIRWVDAEAGKRKTLVPVGKHHGYADAVEGPMIAIAGKVFDARSGRELGSYDGRPLAIDLTGRLLQAAEGAPHSIATGPLRWQPPSR